MPTYYFSNTDGLDTRTLSQAQNQATPFKTLSKHNAITFAPGDSILFKKGDTFTGALNAASGSAGSPVTYGSYGTGAPPVISGFTTLTAWTLLSGHVYYAAIDVIRMQIVLLDNLIKPMGRYPNTTFLPYTSHNTSNSITGAAIGALPFDPTGGEAVVRKDRYYMDRQKINSRSGNTLNLNSTDWSWGRNDQNATDLNGFFIQDHLSTLDTDGDWFYNKTEKRLYMYFTGTPSGRSVMAAGQFIGFNATGASYVNVSGLKFTGFNNSGITHDYANNISITGCTFDKIGANGIEGLQGGGFITINANNFSNCLNGGVAHYEVNNVTITNNVIDSTHMIFGMGKSGDAAGNAIGFNGDNQTITGNKITNTGFNGISWYLGNNVLVEKNFIRAVNLLKDDGGGIYSYGISVRTFVNRIVQDNIIIDAIGNNEGLGSYDSYQNFGLAFGVYLDNFATDVIVRRNTVFNAAGGTFINQYGRVSLIDNTFFDCRWGLIVLNNGAVRSLTVTGNKMIARTAAQLAMYLEFNIVGPSDIANMGTFNNNVYARPFAEGQTIQTSDRRSGGDLRANYTVAAWKTASGKDANSTSSQVTTNSLANFRTEYNDTAGPSIIPLGANYKDVTGAVFGGSLALSGFAGAALIYDSPLSTGAGTSEEGTKKILHRNGVILTQGGKILYIIE